MLMRKVNTELFAKLLQKKFKGSIPNAAKAMDVSETILRELKTGKYEFTVKEVTMLAICEGFEVSEAKLFPRVQDAERDQAS